MAFDHDVVVATNSSSTSDSQALALSPPPDDLLSSSSSNDLPLSPHSKLSSAQAHSSSVVGVTTAGTRALASQLFMFYLRVPVKLFRPTRIDYMALARAINPSYHAKPWNFFTHSGPALLVHAVKEHGWGFIPNHILPPLLANSAIGVVLYTTYLTTLSIQQNQFESNSPSSPAYVQFHQAFVSGALAGAAQSLAAAPIDAIVTRFSVSEILESDHKSLWTYSWSKLHNIGLQGIFAGFSLSLIKETLAYSFYFSTFEMVKGNWYRAYCSWRYKNDGSSPQKKNRILFPSFVLLAGSLAAVALQLVQYPLGKIQKLHLIRLEAIDFANIKHHLPTWQLYMEAYPRTFRQIDRLRIKDAGGSWLRWLYGGFFRSALVSLPSTSIGLIVFEIMRLRYSEDEGFNDNDVGAFH